MPGKQGSLSLELFKPSIIVQTRTAGLATAATDLQYTHSHTLILV